MNSAQREPTPYSPKLDIRLLLWFGIYFLAQVPWIITSPEWILASPLFFPIGLSFPFLYYDGPFLPSALFHALGIFFLGFPYFVYASHFGSCFYFHSRKAFLILMAVLVLVVILNSIGLMKMAAYEF